MTDFDVTKAESVLRMLCEYYTSDFWYMRKHCQDCRDMVEAVIERLRGDSHDTI